MKKHLLLAAALLGASFGVSADGISLANELVADASTLADGDVIVLQCADNNGGPLWYFNGGGTVKSALFDPATATFALAGDQTEGFTLQRVGDGKYLSKSGNATGMVDDAASAVKLTVQSMGENLDGFSVGNLTTPANGDASYQWTNSSDPSTAGENVKYFVRFTAVGTSTFLNTQPQGGNPNYAGGTGGYSFWLVSKINATVDEITATINAAKAEQEAAALANLPKVTEDPAKPVYYLIHHARNNTYYAKAPSADGGQLTMTTDVQDTESTYDKGTLFYFTAAGEWDGTYLPVNIHNALTGKCVVSAEQNSTTWGEAGTWYLTNKTYSESGNTNEKAMLILTTKDTSASGKSWNDFGGGHNKVAVYNANDGGGYWTIDATDPEIVEATFSLTPEQLEALEAQEKVAADEAWMNLMSDFYTSLGVDMAAIKANWDAVKGSLTTLDAVARAGKNAVTKALDGKHITIGYAGPRTEREGEYFAGNYSAGDPQMHSENADARIWTLTSNEEGTGFAILNEYENTYIVFPSALNTNMGTTRNLEEASHFNFVAGPGFETTGNSIAIYCITCTDQYPYLHTNNHPVVVRWNLGDHSQFAIEAAEDAAAAAEHLNGAKAEAEAIAASIGSAIGEFAVAPETVEPYEQAKDVTAEASVEEMRAAADAIWAYVDGAEMIVPTPGHLYRFRGETSLKFMGALNNASGRMDMVAEADVTPVNTLFYLSAENRLVSVATGLSVGTYNRQNRSTWQTLPVENAEVGTLTFTMADAANKLFYILPSASRHLYEKNAAVDCGGGGDGYRWSILTVEEFPVEISAGHTTLYTPFALATDGKVQAYKIVENDGKLEKNLIDSDVIPANTPVWVELNEGAETADGYVYLAIVSATPVVDLIDLDNALTGDVYATTKNEETAYYVAGELNGVKGLAEHDTEATYVPGFLAHYAVPYDSSEDFYEVHTPTTDAIESVEAAAPKADAIYDLQGRRVSRALRGLYIVNGVKTLVR